MTGRSAWDEDSTRTRSFEPLTEIQDATMGALSAGGLDATQAVGLSEVTGEFAAIRGYGPTDTRPSARRRGRPPGAPQESGAPHDPAPAGEPGDLWADAPGARTVERPAVVGGAVVGGAVVGGSVEGGAEGEAARDAIPTAHLDDRTADKRLAGSTLVMAAGTIFSRLSGYIRGALLIIALGTGAHADIFTVANTIPNMVYILVAGGVVNAVLVPQLVRAMKHDADGGDAYANRLVTLAVMFLGVVTVVLVVAAPLVIDLVFGNRWSAPEMAAQRDSAIAFARFCLPQVFFYGMFVLLGQILNARGSFGPMMWAPIANNVISVAVLVIYLTSFGTVADTFGGPFSSQEELLLGLGSTLGIAVQFLVLLPYLRKAGFRFSPRLDFRNTGLGHTFRLAVWTLLFVIVNQGAYLVVTKLASNGAADDGAGMTVYSNVFLVMMVPHSIITVSIATALLPRLSALAEEQRLERLGSTLGDGLRRALAVILPFTVLLPLVASDVATVAWPDTDTTPLVPTLICFAPAMLFFTTHYLMLRGFYAQEQNRLVFFIQVAVSATNIVSAIVLVNAGPASQTAPRLAVAYGCAYAVGALVTYLLMQRRVGTLGSRDLASFGWRMVLALATGAVCTLALQHLLGGLGEGWLVSLLRGGVSGVVGLVAVVLMAYGLRLTEITSIIDGALGGVRRRLRR